MHLGTATAPLQRPGDATSIIRTLEAPPAFLWKDRVTAARLNYKNENPIDIKHDCIYSPSLIYIDTYALKGVPSAKEVCRHP